MSTSSGTASGGGSLAALLTALWRRMPRAFLVFIMLITGGAGLVYEYVLSTVFSYMLGSSIEQFSVTITAMFVAMGIGGLVQSRLRGSLPVYFIVTELLLVLLGGFAPVALEWAFANMQPDFGLIKVVYPGLIGLLMGLEIPLAMRINEARFTKNLGSNIAGTWAWDYIGGAVGVLAWLWLLQHLVPITDISVLVAGTNLLVAVMSLAFFWGHGMLGRLAKVLTPTAVVMVVLGLFAGVLNAGAWTNIVVQKLYDEPIVFNVTTPYQNIVMTKGTGVTYGISDYQLYINGNKQDSSDDAAIYHEYLVHPAMNLAAQHKRVLILGGGDGFALHEVLKYPGVQSVTLVDLDPGMIRLARTNPIMRMLNHDAFHDARVHASGSPGVVNTGQTQAISMDTGQSQQVDCSIAPISGDTTNGCYSVPVTKKIATVDVYNIDADRFIAQPLVPYDVVIVDLPDPDSVELSKLYSLEFYQKVKAVLAPDGIVVVQSTSPYHAKDTFLCVMRTMAAAGLNVVPYHVNVPSFGDWGWVMGSRTLRPDELSRRAANLNTFPVPTTQLTAGSMKAALHFDKGWLTASSMAISTLLNPVIYNYYTYDAWRVD